MDIIYPALTIDKIRTYITARHEHLAIAESVTSGFLQAAFSTAQDASLFFEGGITTYNIDQEERHLFGQPLLYGPRFRFEHMNGPGCGHPQQGHWSEQLC